MVTELGTIAGTVVLAVAAGIVVALLGLAVLGAFVQRSRARAEATLADQERRILQMAVMLADDTRAQGHDARIRLIRAAHAAMGESAQHRRGAR